MKTKLTACLTAIAFALLALPMRLEAQEPHYKLVDLGTLGGPHSYGSINGDGFALLNNSGVVGSFADTALHDPNSPNCGVPDCFLWHAFRWKDGVMEDLGALPGVNVSGSGSTNARGWMAGQSGTPFARISQCFDNLRDTERFRSLLEDMNLPL